MKSVGTICQYLDSVLISRWSYSAQGPTSSLGGQRNIQLESTPARSKHGSNGTSKGSQGHPKDPAQGATVFAPDKVAFFRRLGNVSAQDVIIRFVVSAIGWTSIFCVLNACYSLLAIISVTTGLAPVDQWPPLFGKLADCYSIRQFWG